MEENPTGVNKYMTDCANYFFNSSNPDNTLHQRITISNQKLDDAISETNKLKEFIRKELSDAVDCKIGFWFQGSYKSKTLIKPIGPFDSFDIDMGVYLLDEQDEYDFSSIDARGILNDALNLYIENINKNTNLVSKNSCECLHFNNNVSIDMPLYHKTSKDTKLATLEDWIDSDPKKIQEWLTHKFNDVYVRALMKRVVRYFKAWVNLKWYSNEHKKIPSLAINVLVANNLYHNEINDELSFLHTSESICKELLRCMGVINPLNNDQLINMDDKSIDYARNNILSLKKVIDICLEDIDVNSRLFCYSSLFEHYSPQIYYTKCESTNFPVISNQISINITRFNKANMKIISRVSDSIIAEKGDSLHFTIHNKERFEGYRVIWTVRNVGNQADYANDIGHKVNASIEQVIERGCSYTGKHTMECALIKNGCFMGVKIITVTVKVKPLKYHRKKK